MFRDRRSIEGGRRSGAASEARRTRARFRPPLPERLEDRLALTGPDAAIANVADLSSYQVGSTITYTITVDLEPASDPVLIGTPISVTEFLPQGLANVSASASNWSLSSSSATSPSLVMATYTGAYPVAAGTSLPAITVTGTVTASAAASYTSTASVSVAGDQDLSNNSANWTVGVSSVQPSTLDVAPASGTYGGSTALAAHLTSGGAGLANEPVDFHLGATDLGSATTDANGLATLDGVSYASLAAGTYTGDISASFAGDSSYTASGGAADLTVTPAPLTIAADDQSKVYGAALPTLTSSYSGFVNGDTAASLVVPPTIITSATASSHVAGNPYAIIPGGAVDPNYSISYVSGSLSITPAPLTIAADDQSKVYGAALPTLTASYSGFVNGDTAASLAAPPTIITSATSASHVAGSPYAITAGGAVDLDYAISYVAGSLAVTPAPLSILEDDASKVYGQANPTFTGRISGILNGDDVVAHYATSAGQFSDVQPGGYPIVFVGMTGANAGDYSTTVIGGGATSATLTITPAPLSIMEDDASKVYGQANPTFTGRISGILNGDDVVVHYATSAGQFSDVQAGGYAITFVGLTGAKAGDYSTTAAGGLATTATLTINPAPLTVVEDDASKVYGQANPTFTNEVAGILDGDDVSVLQGSTAGQFSDVRAGGYAITAAGLAGSKAADYSLTVAGASVADGTLTVTPAPLSIAVTNLARVYGQDNPALTGTLSGILDGDDVAARFATTATASSDVIAGGYPIALAGLSGAKAGDYEVAGPVAGTLTITPAPLTVTADDASKEYGQANPAFSASYGGFVLGQGPGVLSGTLGFTTPATAASHVGAYPISPGGLASANYEITDVAGRLSVTPAPLQVTASSVAKVYGQPVPTLAASYSGFVNGDTAANLATPARLTTAAGASSHVGTYPIVASGATSADYAISEADGTLSVTPAPLTVTANDVVKPFIGPLPMLTATYSGFVNGDTLASLTSPVLLATTATGTSAPGFYQVGASGGTAADYSIVDVAGTLAISAPLPPPYDPSQAAFVASLYESLLGRAPEPGGLAFWTAELSEGVSRSEVARRIQGSAEARAVRTSHHGRGITAARALALAKQAQTAAGRA